MLKFQTDVDEETGEQVLTCFLLPQLEYHPDNTADCQQESDDDWEEKEASRTHSVKFTDDLDQDQNKETPFVRQNTPHPKELKAKAHKLFGKGKGFDGKAAQDQMDSSTVQLKSEIQAPELQPPPPPPPPPPSLSFLFQTIRPEIHLTCFSPDVTFPQAEYS